MSANNDDHMKAEIERMERRFPPNVRTRKRSRRQIKAMAFENGLVWGAAIVAWAQAIADRPRYQWKLVQWFREGGESHAVTFHGSEGAAREWAEDMRARTGGFGNYRIVRQELKWCRRCDGTGEHVQSDPSEGR